MRNILGLMVFFLTAVSSFASPINWADTLLGVSSEAKPKRFPEQAFKGYQALGAPSVMPDFGFTPAAWMPDLTRKSIEWLKVGFSNPQRISQVSIHENINPGAISKVYIYDENKGEHLIYNNLNPAPIQELGRVFNIFIPKTSLKINAVKIELITMEYNDYYQIDAVGISDNSDSARVNINLPKDVVYQSHKENLGKNINSQYSELGPIISPDGRTLFFTRDKHPENIGANRGQDVWYSESDSSGNFGVAINIGEPINNDKNNFVVGCSQDGNVIYLGNVYHADGTLSRGVSQSFKVGDGWSFPQQIVIDNYYNSSLNSSYSFAANGKVLILSIERDDSYGANDLYVSFLGDNGVWSEPKNLGKRINTVASEESPFLAADGVSLYFSTSGLPGFGSNDMFVSRRLDSTWLNWSEPINLGPAINTKGWDGYYTITASGDWAYFVSNENPLDAEDIFRIKMPQSLKPLDVVLIKGKVLNAKTKKPVEAAIIYETLHDGKNAGIAKSNPTTGEYTITLPVGYRYGYLANVAGYASINENIDLTSGTQYREYRKDLLLVPIEQGQSVRLNNIFFEFAKYELLPESIFELKRVVKLLEENPSVKILISGHTDNVGTNATNQLLSENRAKAVYDYLISCGIEPSRMKFNGYGAKKPLVSNATESGRRTNRRVEFTIE